MEIWLEGILIGVPVLLLLIRIFATQYISELVKKLFNGRSDEKAFATFYFTLFLSLIIGLLLLFYPVISELETATPEESIREKDTLFIDQDRPKTDKEIDVEFLKEGLETTEEIIEGFQNKNQELREAKGSRLVYQIGDILDNEKSLFKKFKQLRKIATINIAILKVFKIKRNQFLIIYDLHQAEDEMNKGLADFKASLSTIENNISIRELNQECRARQEIVTTKPLDRRKFDFTIECLECD